MKAVQPQFFTITVSILFIYIILFVPTGKENKFMLLYTMNNFMESTQKIVIFVHIVIIIVLLFWYLQNTNKYRAGYLQKATLFVLNWLGFRAHEPKQITNNNNKSLIYPSFLMWFLVLFFQALELRPSSDAALHMTRIECKIMRKILCSPLLAFDLAHAK